jgi:glycosyltransferase involved in cell wall biosynthesis
MNKQTQITNLQTEKIVFLAQGIESPMFLIQSMPFLIELKKNYIIHLVSIEEHSKINVDLGGYDEILSKIKLEFIPHSILCRNLKFIPKIISQIIQICPSLFRFLKKENVNYFHARGYLPSIVLHYLKKFVPLKYIFDMRGVYVDELKLLNNLSEKNLKIKLWRHLENKAIKSAELAIVVSEPFARYVRNIHPESKVRVVKNAIVRQKVSEKEYYTIRNEYRKKLGIENKTVFVYSGSVYKWQLIPQMISFFKYAREKNPEYHFLMICREGKDYITQLFKEFDVDSQSYTIRSVEPEKVKKYLMAGDIGMLFREKNVINEVSDPLKFVEYLYAGLLVVITKYIGDTEESVKKYNLGIVLDSLMEGDVENSIKRLQNLMENRNPMDIINSGTEIYNFQRSLEQYNRCYQELGQ